MVTKRSIAPDLTFARWVSIIVHPFGLILVLTGFAARKEGPEAVVLSLGLLVAAVLLPIGVFCHRRVQSGRWANVDASNVSERKSLYAMSLGVVPPLTAVSFAFPPLQTLGRCSLLVLGLLLVSFLLTRVVKASMHLGFGAFVGMAGLTVEPLFGMLVLASLPLLAWSRIRMGRHSMREVLAGTALGLSSGALSVVFFPPMG